jgi:type IV pilus assembly protein PilA
MQSRGIGNNLCHTERKSNSFDCLILNNLNPPLPIGRRRKPGIPEEQVRKPIEVPDMKIEEQAFTLIELMVVVAIIGILAAIAIPAYQNYTIRAQVSEGLSLSNGAKTSVSTYYADRGAFPTDNLEAGLEAAGSIVGRYVTSVEVGGAVITVTYGNDAHANINANTVTLIATDHLGSLGWVCSGVGIADQHLPAACR